MATLKDHQKAMVDLLANGSAIPASAARLAHALHDVLALMVERDSGPRRSRVSEHVGGTIEDVRFAADLDSAVSPRGSTSIDHLRAELANVTSQRDTYKARGESLEAEVARQFEQNLELKTKLEEAEEKLGY
ncbi:MAG: hypothetical protein RSC43_00670 [Clostridia bacterium]